MARTILIGGIATNLDSLPSGDISSSNVGQSLLDLSSVNWGVKYTYLVYIPKIAEYLAEEGDSPFPKHMIPAFNVQESIPMMRSEKIKIPVYGDFEFPVGTSLPTLQVTLRDDDKCSIEWALRQWKESFVGDGDLAYLDDIVSDIFVFKLTHSRKTAILMKYKGYVSGNPYVTMGSSNELKELQVDFAVTDYSGVKSK